MNQKILLYVSVSMAVVAAAVAAIVVTNNRADVARARAMEAENRADEAKSLEKQEKAAAAKAASEAEKSRHDRETKKLENETEIARRAANDKEEKIAQANAEVKRAESEIAKASAKQAAAEAESAKAKAKTAKLELDRVRAESEAALAKSNAAVQLAAMELAKEERRSAAILAEAKALELRKIDFETLQRDLLELKQDLEERERALMPDVTIYNSSNVEWVAEVEAEVIGGDTNRLLRSRQKVLDENNPALPAETRNLARKNRIAKTELAAGIEASRKVVVDRLARLYAAALRDDRVVDADFYLKSIRQYDPLWDSKASLKQLKEDR